MFMNHRAFCLAILMATAPIAASAAVEQYKYVFGGSAVCGVDASFQGNPLPTCADPGEDYDPFAGSYPSHVPTLLVDAVTDEAGSDGPAGINHFLGGLGIGGDDTTGGKRIGSLDSLFINFDTNVTVLSFEVVTYDGGSQRGEYVNGGVQLFNIPFAGSGAIQEAEGVVASSGTGFTWSGVTTGNEVAKPGYLLYSVTIEYQKDTPIIPVPPALPLLGGAIGLLVWRARKGKSAA